MLPAVLIEVTTITVARVIDVSRVHGVLGQARSMFLV